MLITGKWSTRHLNIVIRITAVIVLVIAFSPATPLNSASANSNLFGIPARAAAAGASTPQLTQIVTGEEHTCALTPAGGVVCWGRNNYGQLGDGTFNPSDVPVPVQGLSSGVVSVSLASDRTCALTSLGRVYCWGNSTDNSPYTSVPVEVTGLGSQVVQLAVGNWHTCALTSSGKILCWGKNLDGELGNGTFTDSSTPVAAIAAGAAQVAVSVTGITGYTTCAVMTNGDVLCWGGGYSGQLGDGAYDGFHKSNLPVHVREADGSPLTGASQVGVGMQYACALVGSGVQCWGSDNDWELGTGEVGVRPFASPVLNSLGGPALSGADQLSTGDEVVCVHLSSGELKCWGWSDSGQIGNGWTGAALFPVTVVDTAGTAPFEGATRISAGGTHSCLFTNWEDAHPFYCWGDDSWGQLGIGSMGYFYKSVPQPVVKTLTEEASMPQTKFTWPHYRFSNLECYY